MYPMVRIAQVKRDAPHHPVDHIVTFTIAFDLLDKNIFMPHSSIRGKDPL